MIDMDTLMPLTNADTKVGMKVLVTMTPAHPNWWDADRKPYECWLPELKKVGMKASSSLLSVYFQGGVPILSALPPPHLTTQQY